MDKNAIKKYAVWARRELIARVSQKAAFYGITEEECVDVDTDSINGRLLSPTEKKQRQALNGQIKNKGYQEVMEEVAYTWFNRFSALRFMEVNGYLPTHVRVFTDEENNFKPQILAEAIHLEMDGLDMEKVFAYKDEGKTDELYKYLLITQCNALNPILPGMFQKISDFTELLFPDNLLRDESVIEQMIVLIPEDDWKDAVQIIGWLYQYYNSEKKDEVFAALKKNVKITKENIPAATQLFTPEWIVRYMVENSLGRLWLEGHPNDQLKSEWKYYLDEAEQDPDVQVQLEEIRKEYATLKPEDIKCIDPCCGSGHILAYMFDVLVKIYEAYGYTTREAVSSIVEKNIYGLDIDDRAAQLANFAIVMKARQYDHRFFSRKIRPHVYSIVESNHIEKNVVDYFINGDIELDKAINISIDELHNAKEYGSILTVTQQEWKKLYVRIDEIREDINISRDLVLNELLPIVQVAENLSQKYDVVVTNPPYMGSSGMSKIIAEYVKKYYPDSKSDLFAVFIEKCRSMVEKNRFQSMITQHAWMFLSSYEKLRANLLDNDIINMVHLGAHAFEEIGGEVVQTTAFVMRNGHVNKYIGKYCRLIEPNSQQGKENMFLERTNRFLCCQSNYIKVPGTPIAYWISDKLIEAFNNSSLYKYSKSPSQNITGNNGKFVRKFWEIDSTKVDKRDQWIFYAKGGGYRKWWGNLENVVNWTPKARDIYKFGDGSHASQIINSDYWYKKGITWGLINSTSPSFRIMPEGATFDKGGSTVIVLDEVYNFTLALLNSKVYLVIAKMLNPTLNFQVKDVRAMPLILKNIQEINLLVDECVSISKMDWDSFEISWEYKRHPFVSFYKDNQIQKKYQNSHRDSSTRISCLFKAWEDSCKKNFSTLKRDEERLNEMFIEIYGLQNDLTSELEEKDITVRKADLQREIRSFISYIVGCMFGRYSLDIDGLVFAGGKLDISQYSSFPIDKDNIIPICDDEYFEDDIVTLFIKFIEKVYGEETLNENLKFISDALDGKGQPKEVIRNYFMNDFFNDHCKLYQKCPIYWLFDSGKKNGFKALIYMHRYQSDTIARIRTDYVHEQQSRYRTAIVDMEKQIVNAGTSDSIRLTKQLKKLQDQSDEIHVYEEKIHHLADQMISIDLDDGVKVNYAKFEDVLAKIK